jgi:hypothetical protein
MKIKIRKGDSNLWSFVEVWDRKYKYEGYGVVKALVGLTLTPDGFVSLPMVLKGNNFQSLSSSLQLYDLPTWLNSKKPIYSSISQTIVRFVVRYDLATLKPDFEHSSFELYQPIMDLATEEFVPLTRVFSLSSELEARLDSIMRHLFEGSVDRVTFLERRLAISESSKDNKQERTN